METLNWLPRGEVDLKINNAFHNPMQHHVWCLERCAVPPPRHASPSTSNEVKAHGPLCGAEGEGVGRVHRSESFCLPPQFLSIFGYPRPTLPQRQEEKNKQTQNSTD